MTIARRLLAAALLSASFLALVMQGGSATAQPKKAVPIPPSPQAPTIAAVGPNGATRGTSVDLRIAGTNLEQPLAVWTSFPSKSASASEKGKEAATKINVKLDVPADAPIGQHTLRIATRAGVSNAVSFCVDDLPSIAETEANHSTSTAQPITPPCVVTGRTDVEMSDFFKFAVKPGQRLTFEALGRRLGSNLDPILLLRDAKTGREIPGAYSDDAPGLQTDARLTHTFKEAGEYIIEIRDTTHRGGPDNFYRLRIGDFPAVLAAMPVAIKRGSKARVRFAGPALETAVAVELAAPVDPRISVIPAIALGASGQSAWPVPVAISDIDEIVEIEPNDAARPQQLTLPIGITGLFGQKNDHDVFQFPAKKGTKYILAVETYDIGSPAEVYMVLKGPKGAELAKSVPTAATARIEHTAVDDGPLTLDLEHLNYAHGPNELYHLTIRAAEPEVEVALGIDRVEAAPGGTAYVPVTGLIRRDYPGPIELIARGDPGIAGRVIIPANFPPAMPALAPGTPIAYMPVTVGPDVKPGAYAFSVEAIADKATRLANVADVVKARMANLPFPPRETLSALAIGVVEKPPFALAFKNGPKELSRGASINVALTATRSDGFAEEIALTLVAPPGVTATIKPIAKGAADATVALTVPAGFPTGPLTIAIKGVGKVAGKDVALYSSPLVVNVSADKPKDKEKDKPKEKDKDKK